jgi:hypothetical protein
MLSPARIALYKAEDYPLTEITIRPQRGPLLRRLLFLLVLFLLLIGVNLLYQPALNYSAIQSGEAGELLYAAGFDGFADEWQQYEGRRLAQMTDGVMQIGLEINDIIYSPSSPVYADFDVQVTIRPTNGERENDGYGLIFRLTDASDERACLRQFVTLCNLEKVPVLDTVIGLLAPAPKAQASGYYVFLISPDGYYSIWRGDENNNLAPVTVWHYSNGLLNEDLNVENRVRIVGRGSDFQFFLNGELVNLCVPLEGEQATGIAEECLGEVTDTWHDESFATGKLGLIVNGSTVAPITVEFDNFIVTMPEAPIEGDGL